MTKSVLSRKHLKLVVTEASGHGDSAVLMSDDGVQLTLPFDEGKAVVLMHEADLRAPGAFDEFLGHYQPRWLFDIRVAPRMDFIAPTRTLALRHLSMLNVSYVDVLGHVNDTSKWLPFVENLLQSPDCTEGPYAIVFDDHCRLRDARLRLPSLFHQMDPSETISISTYGRNLIAL